MSDSVESDGLEPSRLLCPWTSPGKNTGVSSHVLFQGTVPTQGSNLHLSCLLCWQVCSLPLAPPGKPNQCSDLPFYFWLHWVFVAACRLSLVAASGGCSLGAVHGFLLTMASLVVVHRRQQLQHTSSEVTVCEHRLCSCAQRSCSRWNLPEPGLKSMSPALGRRILNHWTTREAPTFSSLTRLTNHSKYISEQKQPHEAEAALA